MSDNVSVTPGSGIAVAADDVGGVFYQRVKVSIGADGTAADLAFGSTAAASSLPTALSTEDATRVGSITETAPNTDTASSGLNGRLQRIAQRLTALGALFPGSLGQKTKASALAVTLASDEDLLANLGGLTETAPGTDTASSGLNGRLQRIAQRITSLIALFPGTLGQKAKSGAFAVTLASDEDLLANLGGLTETAPGTDTASSGLNGRLQRIAQRFTSLIALVPASLGQKPKANAFAVTLASDEDLLVNLGGLTETAPGTDTASSGLNGRLQRIAQRFTSLIALVPASLGQKTKSAAFAVTLASDEDLLVNLGGLTETAPASDTASSGLNGRLQRIAQRITTMIAGPSFATSGVSPVTGTLATGILTTAFTPNAGRVFYLELTGTGSVTGTVVYLCNNGTTYAPNVVATGGSAPTLLDSIAYNGGTQNGVRIGLQVDQAGMTIKFSPGTVTGTINYALVQ